MPNVDITIVTEAAEKPVTLSEAKAWLRITHNEDDAMITELIASATNSVETYINNPIITKTFLYKNDASLVNHSFEEFLYLPYVPSSIEFVKIYDTTNTGNELTTTSQYQQKILLGMHGVTPRNNHAYQAQFQAGISSDASTTPSDIKIVIKEIISHLYDGDCCNKTMSSILGNLSGHMNFNQIALQ